jgi:hypothetical protein
MFVGKLPQQKRFKNEEPLSVWIPMYEKVPCACKEVSIRIVRRFGAKKI